VPIGCGSENYTCPRKRSSLAAVSFLVRWLAPLLGFACALVELRAPAAPCAVWAGFHQPALYSSSADQVVLVRDLDGDGVPEIIASGNQVEQLGSFSLFRNLGDGSFESERLIPSALGEKLEAVGDLDGDGIPDLVASNYWANGIAVHAGAPSLQFGAGVPYGTATHGGPSLIADYDGDGIPDVISFSFGSGNPVRIHLFHGNGDGSLAPKVTTDTAYANATSPSLRFIGGGLEILAGERSGHLVLVRYAAGTLTTSTLPAGPGIDLSSTFGDVNGDGVADIIGADDDSPGGGPDEALYVTLGKADGTFGQRTRLAQPRHVVLPVELRVADVDGDGRADLVVSDFRSRSIYVFLGDGRGGFAEGLAFDAGGPVNFFALADVDGDGRPDIVAANDDHTVSVLRNACGAARRRAVRR